MKKLLMPLLLFLSLTCWAYQLRSDDVLSVDVYFHTGGVVSKVTIVDHEGYASLPYVGYVKVEGMDLEDIRKMIQKKVDEFLPSAIVVVYVSKPHPEYVYFHGVVSGVYDLSQIPEGKRRLSNVLAMMVKGYKIDVPMNLRIIRKGKVMDVDLREYLKTGDESYDPVLEEGDVVYTPAPEYVGVFGDAVVPGAYEVSGSEKLLELLSRAKLKVPLDAVKFVRIFRGEETFELSGSDIDDMMNFEVKGGDMVLVEPYRDITVYVIGEVSKKVEMSEKKDHTLRSLISDLGITFKGSEKWRVSVLKNDGKRDFTFGDPSSIPDLDLENGDLIVIEKVPEYVTVRGVISGRFDLSSLPEGDRRLSVVLTSLGEESTVERVEIRRGNSKILVNKTGETWENDPVLKAGDEIYTYGPESVAVYGNGAKPGIYDLRPSKSLFDVLVKAGVDLRDRVKVIKVFRNGEAMVLDPSDVEGLKKFELRDGDAVEVVPYETVNVYLNGDVSRKLSFSEREEPDLREALSAAGIVLKSGLKYRVKILRNDSSMEYEFENAENVPKVLLKDGDFVIVKVVNPPKVYVNGVGSIEFTNPDEMNLKSLLYRVGAEGGVVFITRGASTTWFRVKDVMKGKKNVELQNGDYVYLSDEPFGRVNVIYGRTSQVSLREPEEDILSVVFRSGLLGSLDDIESILLLRGSDELELKFEDLLNGEKRVEVRDGDTVVLKPREGKLLYVVGDISTVLTFSRDEDISRDTVIAKLGVDEKSVESISGDMRDGGILKIRLKRVTKVYTYGDALGSSVITFQPTEDRDLKSLIGKLGIRFPSKDFSYEVSVIREGRVEFRTTLRVDSEPSKLEFELKDGDFVKIVSNMIEVDVFGTGIRQGRYSLTRGSKLRDLLAKMGGIPTGFGMIEVIRSGDLMKMRIDENRIPDFELKDGDVIVFNELPDEFVYVFGDVTKPGMIFVGKGEKLVKVLSLTGGLYGWDVEREIRIIKKSGEVEELTLNQESLLKISVEGGDMVYVVPRSLKRVYVLGAILRPSVVPIDQETTLLDAIMRAGGFSKSAVKEKVYVFRGGVNGPIEVYDMSWIEGRGKGRNPKLRSGDIVFVPDNPMMSINEMISLITPMMSFINNSINLYKNVKGLW